MTWWHWAVGGIAVAVLVGLGLWAAWEHATSPDPDYDPEDY